MHVCEIFEERKYEGWGSQARIGADLIDSQPVQILEESLKHVPTAARVEEAK